MKKERKKYPLTKEKIKKPLKDLFIWCIITILIFCGAGIFILKDYSVAYRFFNAEQNPIGIAQEENFFDQTTTEYYQEITNKGFYIVDFTIDLKVFYKKTLVPTVQLENQQSIFKQQIRDSIKITVLTTGVEVQNKKIYFKSDSEAESFIQSLKDIDKDITYKKENIIQEITYISTEEDKQMILQQIKKEKEIKEQQARELAKKRAIEQERKRKAQISSRSGNFRRKAPSNVPLRSYVYISSPYGMRHGRMHTGVDFAAHSGTEILAWKSGTVTTSKWCGGYGNFVEIKHNDGTVSRYAHLSKYNCKAGQQVQVGQVIGFVGSTGNSTGPHLHFEIKVNGNFVNPMNYLK